MNNIKIIVTAYNAEKWICKCIQIIQTQTFCDFKVIIIDDASTDNTFRVIEDTLKRDCRFKIIRNYQNKKALTNYINYLPEICNDDNDIIISIDGDDFLYDNSVIEKIHNIYNDNKELLLTYGQYIVLTDLENGNIRKGCSRQIQDMKHVRELGFNFSHLKTWKYKLWKNIKIEDFNDQDGKICEVAWDSAMMCPMVEMAGIDRVKYIDDILYIYNDTNPLNDYKVDESYQARVNSYIKGKKTYERI